MTENSAPMDAFTDAYGTALNEVGEPLVGVSPPDSAAYAALREALRTAIADPQIADRAVAVRRISELTALTAAMPDAGERLDAQRRINQFEDTVAAITTATPQLGPTAQEAYAIRTRAEQTVDDPATAAADRVAACREAIAQITALAVVAGPPDEPEVRAQAGILERLLATLEQTR